MGKKIRLLKNNEIDLQQWDKVVTTAINSRVYAESWYLDVVAPNWMGLVYGDYEYVVPIFESKKFGISYLFQPPYSQQHGVFPPSVPKVTEEILVYLKQSYKYFDLSLNALNFVDKKMVATNQRVNYVLPLKYDYQHLKTKYNSHTRRNLKKGIKKCTVNNFVNIQDYLNLKQKYAPPGFNENNLKVLKLIMLKAVQNNRGKIYGAYSDKNELVAAAFFLYDNKRVTYLNSVSSDIGKDLRAMYTVIDRFIQNHQSGAFVLDFEGSMIDGIARFFSGFGASPENYLQLHHNKLPWPLRVLKK